MHLRHAPPKRVSPYHYYALQGSGSVSCFVLVAQWPFSLALVAVNKHDRALRGGLDYQPLGARWQLPLPSQTQPLVIVAPLLSASALTRHNRLGSLQSGTQPAIPQIQPLLNVSSRMLLPPKSMVTMSSNVRCC